MRLVFLATAVALAGCAATSSIVPMGGGMFMMSKQAATGFPGLGNLKAEVLTEANAHCQQMNKSMRVINSSETQPPYILGNYPRVEVQFRCE